jgi:cell division protease FtsH
LIYALVLFALNYSIVTLFLPPSTSQRANIPYTLFTQQVQASNVAQITAQGDQIQGSFKQPVTYTPAGSTQAAQVTTFATVQPTFADPNLLPELEQQGVLVNATSLDQTTPWWLNLLLGFGPTILLIGGFMWLSSRATAHQALDVSLNTVHATENSVHSEISVLDLRERGHRPKGRLCVGRWEA